MPDQLTTQERGNARRRLPSWLGDGPLVSPLAYDICVEVLNGEGLGAVHLATRLGVDEADVLRAFAELKRVGVMASE